MKKLLIALFIMCLANGIQAQEKNTQHLTQKEFRARQEAFITKKAELSKEEASKFFPLFFELQNEKKALNDKVRKKIKPEEAAVMTDAQYENILNNMYDSRIRAAELDKEYYNRFKQILSAGKIYKVQQAEMRFKRNMLKYMNKPNKEVKKAK